MKSPKPLIAFVAAGTLVLVTAILYRALRASLERSAAIGAVKPVRATTFPSGAGTEPAGADQADPRGRRGGLALPDPAILAATARTVRSSVTNAVEELAKLRGGFSLTEAERNAVAQAVADCAVDYQAVHRRLARVSAQDAVKTTVSVPAFPDAGRKLERDLAANIAGALADHARGTELADALGMFLVREFRGFGQYPREISIGIIRDVSGDPFYSFEDHWTGGWSGHLGGQPADASVTVAGRSDYRPDDLQDYEFLRPLLPEITNAVTATQPGVPAKP